MGNKQLRFGLSLRALLSSMNLSAQPDLLLRRQSLSSFHDAGTVGNTVKEWARKSYVEHHAVSVFFC